MNLPRPANSELFPTTAPGLALAELLPILRARMWQVRPGRYVVSCEGITRTGDVLADDAAIARGDVLPGEPPIGQLLAALDDAGHGACGLRVTWWDGMPAETVPSIARGAADVRAHETRLAAAPPAARRRQR